MLASYRRCMRLANYRPTPFFISLDLFSRLSGTFRSTGRGPSLLYVSLSLNLAANRIRLGRSNLIYRYSRLGVTGRTTMFSRCWHLHFTQDHHVVLMMPTDHVIGINIPLSDNIDVLKNCESVMRPKRRWRLRIMTLVLLDCTIRSMSLHIL